MFHVKSRHLYAVVKTFYQTEEIMALGINNCRLGDPFLELGYLTFATFS